MATSLKEIRREMLARNQALGLKFNLASATTTTAVVTALAAGGFTQGRFFGRFLVRAEAATAAGADRVRRVTDFTASSGTLTHAGANYTDTTVQFYNAASDLVFTAVGGGGAFTAGVVRATVTYWLTVAATS